MNIITVMLPFFHFCGEGLFSPISRYIVEEPRTQKTKKATKKKKEKSHSLKRKRAANTRAKGLVQKKGGLGEMEQSPSTLPKEKRSNDKDSIHLREKD